MKNRISIDITQEFSSGLLGLFFLAKTHVKTAILNRRKTKKILPSAKADTMKKQFETNSNARHVHVNS